MDVKHHVYLLTSPQRDTACLRGAFTKPSVVDIPEAVSSLWTEKCRIEVRVTSGQNSRQNEGWTETAVRMTGGQNSGMTGGQNSGQNDGRTE